MTLVELLVAMLILATLSWALIQLLASGMSTWRSGEMRRGAYERAQFIFDRMARDLAALYPHNPAMPESWAFQADTLFAPNYDGTGNDAVTFTHDNISLAEDEGARCLMATNPSGEAWIQYRFTPPVEVVAAVVQPKIRLSRSDSFAATCKLIIEAKKDSGGFQNVAEFASGPRDQTITPNVDISSVVSGGEEITVRLRISAPVAGQQSDIKLFEAKENDPVRPVFRFAVSPKKCLTSVDVVSDYGDGASQYLVFVRSARGLEEVAYFVDDDTLYRTQRDAVGGSGTLFDAGFSPQGGTGIAKGIVYFGCNFPGQAPPGQDPRMQLYWREADSVPPFVQAVVATVPLSGAKTTASLWNGISATDDSIRVDSTRPFVVGDEARRFIKIGAEWISYTRLEKNRFLGCVRGVRGTVPAPHGKGDVVIGAETFYVNIPIPAWGYRSR